MNDKPYPQWVCQNCGITASDGRARDMSTWHKGECEVCGKIKPVTEARYFYYPIFEGFKRP